MNTETHAFQFTGIHLPAEIVQLVTRKKISAGDLLLLVMIDSLVDRSDGGLDCWASNAYIARSIGLTPNHVCRRIHALAEIGLLVITQGHRNGMPQRFLRASWSRIPKFNMPAGRVNIYPVPDDDPDDCQIGNNPICMDADGGSASMQMGGSASMQSKIRTKNEEYSRQVPADGDQGKSPRSDKARSVMTIDEPSPARKLATKLFKACLKKGTLGVNTPSNQKPAEKTTKAWAKEIDKLLRLVKPADADAVLSWYVEVMGQPYIPEVYCGRSFHLEFDKLRRAMIRQQAQYVDSNGRTRQHVVDDNFVPEHLRW